MIATKEIKTILMQFRIKLFLSIILLSFSVKGYSQTIKFFDPEGSFSFIYSTSWQQAEKAPGVVLNIIPKVPLHREDLPTIIQVGKTPKWPGISAKNVTDLAMFLDKKYQDNAATLKIKPGSIKSSIQNVNGISWYAFNCTFDYGNKLPLVNQILWETIFDDSLYLVSLNAPIANFMYAMPVAELVLNSILFKGSSNELINQVQKKAEVLALSIPPEPRVIDYGEIDDFHESFSVARKGDDYTIIDTLGNERLPLGKYALTTRKPLEKQKVYSGFFNGMCVVQDRVTMLYGFIDTSFKLVIPCVYNAATIFQKDGYAQVTQFDEKQHISNQYFIDKKGKRFIIKNTSIDEYFVWGYNPNQSIITEKMYYRKNGAFAFKVKFGNSEFSDAMSRVSENFNGETRYGFIDTTGKQIIPSKFTGEVMNFSEGLATYKPNYVDVYKYSFINKKGDEVFRLNVSDSVTGFYDLNPFKYGYADFTIYHTSNNVDYKALIDKKGQIIILERLFKRALPNYADDNPEHRYSDLYFKYIGRTKHLIYFTFPYQNGLIHGSLTEKNLYGNYMPDLNTYMNPTNKMGAMSYEGKIFIPPVFNFVGAEDPVSGVMKAGFGSPYDNKFANEFFLNSRGQIILILKTPYTDFKEGSIEYYSNNYSGE